MVANHKIAFGCQEDVLHQRVPSGIDDAHSLGDHVGFLLLLCPLTFGSDLENCLAVRA